MNDNASAKNTDNGGSGDITLSDSGALLSTQPGGTDIVHRTGSSNQLQQIIKKSHIATMSCQEMTAVEQKIVAAMILVRTTKLVEGNADDPQVFTFTCQLLSQLFGRSIKDLHSILKLPCDRSTSRRYAQGDGSQFVFINYFESAIFSKDGLILRPTNYYLQHLQNTEKGIVLVDPEGYFRLKGDHAVRLYEILSRFKDEGFSQHPIPLYELQKIFGVYNDVGTLLKKTYKKASVFFDRVISRAIKEIEENPKTRTKLLFFDGEQGKRGFTYNQESKAGGTITFHYRWTLNSNSVTDVLNKDLAAIIKMLEIKRQTHKLEIDELKTLKSCYEQLDVMDRVDKIDKAIRVRIVEQEQKLNTPPNLDFLAQLDSLNDKPY